MAHWEEFYASQSPPANFEESKTSLQVFCDLHRTAHRKIVLVTSGGTTVPLEHNTVRFVDNFSAGSRGSASAEHFLEKDYAVIFLHRLKSLEPYVRHFAGQKVFDMLDVSDDGTAICVKRDHVPSVLPILTRYQAVRDSGRLLQISFTTLGDYLWLLRAACEYLAPLGCRAMLYLAAAVSDFYVPSNQMPEHKMQSAEGPPTISLQLVPKMLAPLVNLWVPHAYVASFKLETDEQLLVAKSRSALDKYRHNLVIANILDTRKRRVVFVDRDSSRELTLSEQDELRGLEIEEKIVDDVTALHDKFITKADGV